MKSLTCGVMVAAALLMIPAAGVAQAVQDPSAQCSLDLATKPDFALIADKLPIGGRKISFAMLANDTVPTSLERTEIAALFQANEDCGKVGESFRQANYPPEVNSELMVTLTANDLVGVDLYKGRISYGEANKRLASIRDDLISKMTTTVQQYKKELAEQQARTAAAQAQARDRAFQASIQEQQAEAQQEAQRQQRAQMILNYLRANRVQIAPPPNLQIRQPVTSNCVLNGNQANCTSN